MNDTLLVAQEVSANAQKAAIAEGKLTVASLNLNAKPSSIFTFKSCK